MKYRKCAMAVLGALLCLVTACHPVPEASRLNPRLAGVDPQAGGAHGVHGEDETDTRDEYPPYLEGDELFQATLSMNGQKLAIRAHVSAPPVNTAQELVVKLRPCDQQEQERLSSVWFEEDAYRTTQAAENRHEWFRQLCGVQDDRRYIEFASSITFHAGYASQEPGAFAQTDENRLSPSEFEELTGTPIETIEDRCSELLKKMALSTNYPLDPIISCYGKAESPAFCEVVFPRAYPQLPAWGRPANYTHTPTTLKESRIKVFSGDCVGFRCTGQQILDIFCAQSSIVAQHEISLLPFSTIIAALENQFYMDPPVTVSGEPMDIQQIDLCYVGEPLIDDSVGPNDLILQQRMRPMWVFSGVGRFSPDERKIYFIDAETGEMMLTGM